MAEEEVHPIGQTRRDVSWVAAGEASDEDGLTVGVMLEIQNPALLPELANRLAANGCVISAIVGSVCHVVHTGAIDADEELNELRFFIRAWQASTGGVEVTLRPDALPDVAADSG